MLINFPFQFFRLLTTLEDGTKGSPEKSVSNHLTPRNNPEDGRIQFDRGGSLRSRDFPVVKRLVFLPQNVCTPTITL